MQPREIDLPNAAQAMAPGQAGDNPDGLALPERTLAGEATALDELVHKHYEHVWRVVWRIVRNDQQAEELVQEVFLSACTALDGSAAEDVDGESWLRQIAMSKARSFVSAGRGGKPRLAPTAGPGPTDTEHDALLLQQCLGSLDYPMRAVVALQLEGLSYDQIAQALGIRASAVRSRLALAREALAKYVGRKKAIHA